jgi:hypothetical protein
VRVPTSLLIAAMIAYSVVSEERMEKLEGEREWARRGWGRD